MDDAVWLTCPYNELVDVVDDDKPGLVELWPIEPLVTINGIVNEMKEFVKAVAGKIDDIADTGF